MYELDEETGVEDDISPVQKEGVTRRGWLYKAPAYGVASISIRVITSYNIAKPIIVIRLLVSVN